MTQRVLSWFSAGAASAVATKLALAEHSDVTIYRTETGAEHSDNVRFTRECAEWFGQEVHELRSERYRDTWQVWEERRFLNGPQGALCTVELKKKMRFAIERDYDVQVFGYTADKRDAARADRFRQQNPDVVLSTPLIDRGLTKRDCLAMIERAGIEIPAMYRLGYANNNCIGCVKGGIGYWNQGIRRDFPDTYDRMAKLEREIGHSVLSDDNGPVWLDELDPARGSFDNQPDIDCSLLCALAEDELG